MFKNNLTAIKIVSLSLFFSTQAFCIGGLQTLHNFSISASSQKHSLKAIGVLASIGSFVPVLASQNVEIELTDLITNKITKHLCSSFTFEMSDSFTTCELVNDKKTLAIDFDNSNFNTYPLK